MFAGNLVLQNANIITLNARQPRAETLVAAGGKVVWLGKGAPPSIFVPRGAPRLDCEGATVVPGFVDPHCHPLALGASLAAVDCSPRAASSIGDIQARVRARARSNPGDGWIHAAGYDDLRLAERRHPTRRDLDRAAPGRPVRLTHCSGHATVLNSAALRALGIDAGADEPPGAVIDREPESGEPSGVLLEMESYIAARLPPRSRSDVLADAQRASEALLAAGVTSVTDAAPHRGTARYELYARLRTNGVFAPRVAVMFDAAGPPPLLPVDHGIGVGPAKVVLTMTGGSLTPSRKDLTAIAAAAARGGWQLAVHAVEAEAIIAACAAFETAGGRDASAGWTWRIEHASECPAHAIERIARSGATVVAQPGFIACRGERYIAATSEDSPPTLDALYPLRDLLEAGVMVAGASDAPYGPVSPLEGMAAAVTRRTDAGRAVGLKQAIDIDVAMLLFGPRAAAAQRESGEKGVLAPGCPADLAVLSADPCAAPAPEIGGIRVLRTILGGVPVWPVAGELQ